jgi:hypothetical protein
MKRLMICLIAFVAVVIAQTQDIPLDKPTILTLRTQNPTIEFIITVPENLRITSSIVPDGNYEFYAKIGSSASSISNDFQLMKRNNQLTYTLEPSISKRIIWFKGYTKVDGNVTFNAASSRVTPTKVTGNSITTSQSVDYSYVTFPVKSGDLFNVTAFSTNQFEMIMSIGDFPSPSTKSKFGTSIQMGGLAVKSTLVYVGVRKASTCTLCSPITIQFNNNNLPDQIAWFIWVAIGGAILVALIMFISILVCILVCCGVIAAPVCCACLLGAAASESKPQVAHVVYSQQPQVVYTEPTEQRSSQPLLQQQTTTYQSVYPTATYQDV